MTVLTDKLKARIQDAYRKWLKSREFDPRRGQREMIAEIARVCTGSAPRIAAIEAGTGTGKTAAYCLATIPIAQELEKTVVIASATVALQEQIMLRDLPDLAAGAGLDFDFALAKGRGRYVCLKRLDERLNQTSDHPAIDDGAEDAEDHDAVHREILDAFTTGRWDGEIDSWPRGIDAAAWRQVTTDHRGCTNNRCTFFQACPFFKARNGLDGVRVIVANQDLLLADLNLGGGYILPEPEECIVVVDEAHHLPVKTQQHFASRAWINGTAAWADQVNKVVASLTQRFARPPELEALATRIPAESDAVKTAMRGLGDSLGSLDFTERQNGQLTCRFRLGGVGDAIADAAGEAGVQVAALGRSVARVHEMLGQVADGDLAWPRAVEADDWLPAVGQLEGRGTAVEALLDDYAGARSGADDGVRSARWVNRTDQDTELISAPIEPGRLLEDCLWSRCFAAVTTSATLTAVGRFDRFLERAGIGDIEGTRIPSPFDFPNIAVLCVPAMRTDPRARDAHTAEIAALLPELLVREQSALVLFTSWRQLNDVKAALPAGLADALQIQGERSKQRMLKRHRTRIDDGEPSYLLGLASFAEGVDLPDEYCRHVVLAKLPFAVPDDPVDEALTEWLEEQGRNAFMEVSVPDAAMRLVQACGRLIRHEGDHGRITILDRRLVTRGYGRALLDSLPPYRLELP